MYDSISLFQISDSLLTPAITLSQLVGPLKFLYGVICPTTYGVMTQTFTQKSGDETVLRRKGKPPPGIDEP